VRDLPGTALTFRLPPDSPASEAMAVAATSLSDAAPVLEFLPPRVSAWQQFAARYPSGRLAYVGAAVGTLAALVALAFLGQQFVLWKWQGKWDGMKARVSGLESIQKDIRLYRPWFDDSVRSLSILRRLTEAFPEDGSVTAKSVEIRSSSRVTCSGTARDTQAWLRMLDQLRNGRGIADVQVEQVRGKSPLEFTFNFRWEGIGGS